VSSKHNTNPGNPSLAERAGSAVLWRGFGLGAEKIIFLLRLLVLARLVAPAEFGLVAIGMTATAFMARITDFGLVPALVQNPSGKKSHLDTAWTISVLRGCGITIVLFIAAPYIAALFDEPGATNIIRALVLATLVNAAASIEIARITRDLQFRALTVIRLSSVLVNTAVSIYLATSLGAWALVWGTVAGAAAFAVASYVVAPYRPAFRLSGAGRDRVLRFGRWIFLIGVLGVMGDALLRWMVSTRLGVAELGLLFMAVRLAFLPAQLITDLLDQVAFPVYASLQHDRPKLARVFRSMLTSLLVLLLPAALIFIVVIPGLVEHVLGAQWNGISVLMQVLVFASVIGILGDAAIPLLKGVGTPSKVAGLDAIRLTILVIAAWGLLDTYGLLGVGVAEIIATIVSQLTVAYVLLWAIDRPFSGLLPILSTVTGSALIGALVASALIAVLPGPAGLVISVFAGGLASVTIGVVLDRALGLGLLRRLSEPFPRITSLANRFMRST